MKAPSTTGGFFLCASPKYLFTFRYLEYGDRISPSAIEPQSPYGILGVPDNGQHLHGQHPLS